MKPMKPTVGPMSWEAITDQRHSETWYIGPWCSSSGHRITMKSNQKFPLRIGQWSGPTGIKWERRSRSIKSLISIRSHRSLLKTITMASKTLSRISLINMCPQRCHLYVETSLGVLLPLGEYVGRSSDCTRPTGSLIEPCDWEAFKAHQKATVATLRSARWNYIGGMHNDGLESGNHKPFCRYVKSQWQDNCGVSPLERNGELHSKSQTKAPILNDQFSSLLNKDNQHARTVLEGPRTTIH